MSKIRCVYFVTDENRIPVKDFIDSLDFRTQQKFFTAVERLEEFGKALCEPHMKHLGEDIYELRFSGIEGVVGILHFFYWNDKAVLTNGFVKKTRKTPLQEIQKAQERREIYLSRKDG